MFEQLLKDYYSLKISLKELCEKADISQPTFYRELERRNLPARRKMYGMIDFGVEELNEKLKQKYTGIVKRCNGNHLGGDYKGMDYMPLNEWVDFCDNNREVILSLWNQFIENGRKRKYSVSIDRVDSSKGYTKDNLEFVTMGYNSWKKNIRPIWIETERERVGFLTCEEASRYFGENEIFFRDTLNHRVERGNYRLSESNVDGVLRQRGFNNLKEYYENRH